MRPEPATDRAATADRADSVDRAGTADRADRADRAHAADRAVGADDSVDLDAVDAFGHPALADPARDDAEWPDGDEDDIDV